MPKSRSRKLPEFGSIAELTRFFDTHDMGEYAKELPEAHFEVTMKSRKYLVAIDGKLMSKVTKIARSKKLPPEQLTTSWLEEKVLEPNSR